MVSAVRRGTSVRSVARHFGVSPSQVSFWCARAGEERLDRVDFSDRRPGAPRSARRLKPVLERVVLQLRRSLREDSVLGEFGADAIRRAWPAERGPCPSRATVNRVLSRHGVLDVTARRRHPPPPKGWYLPDVASGQAELDSFDLIEELNIAAGPSITVLTGISLHGGHISVWPGSCLATSTIVEFLLERWQQSGMPSYAQFDNDTRFQGAHQWPDTIGRVSRMCLGLGVIPVFAPPREPGFQNLIENLNGLWQRKVWSRSRHANLAALQARSDLYVSHHRQRSAPRRDVAPERRPFPADWTFDPTAHPQGRMIFIRRTDVAGRVRVLGNQWPVSSLWVHRLTRCEVNLTDNHIDFYALRRRDPDDQPLLARVPYIRPRRPFKG